MKLNLRKPLIFFDLETTGLNIMTDRIVEIAYLKVYPNGNEESKKMRINPGMHIPEESTEVHHISDEDVKDCPTFKQVAQSIANDFKGCDIAGYNSNNLSTNKCDDLGSDDEIIRSNLLSIIIFLLAKSLLKS